MNYMKVMSERLRAARLALPRTADGKPQSQEEFASKVAGLSPSRYGNYEQGKRYPDPDMWVKMADALDEPPAYLAGLANDQTAELLRAFHKMDEADKLDVLQFALRRKSLSSTDVGAEVGAKHKQLKITVGPLPVPTMKGTKPTKKQGA